MSDIIHWLASSFIGKLYLGFVIVSASTLAAFLANVLVDRFTTIQKERDSIEGDKNTTINNNMEDEDDVFDMSSEEEEEEEEDLDYLKDLVKSKTVEEKNEYREVKVETPTDFSIVDFIDVIENEDVRHRSFSGEEETPHPRSHSEEDETF